MNRRSFFKAFGRAILGAAIALKIPETLVPRFDQFSCPVIVPSFSQLHNLINTFQAKFNKYPNYLSFSNKTYEALCEYINCRPTMFYGVHMLVNKTDVNHHIYCSGDFNREQLVLITTRDTIV